MDDKQSKTAFIGLSQALTGIAGSLLVPQFDSMNILQTIYDGFVNNAGPYAAQVILERFVSLRDQGLGDDEIAGRILADADNGPVAASLTKLWLLGNWYPLGSQSNPVVISSNAYIQGWAWKIAQAHPMGYSELEPGSWAEPPPPLGDYITPTPQS
ncbi:hypothetical protein SAE02_00410 [Skermanella aerolata]|uniref:Sorbitol dehydrogenase n=1 Tax=Skermanella aerolata TaxID=393310 RepID=A0A512DHD1_9PROT|nr:hypothetical protein [Skermanella aerolata]KJB94088.1 hypothetical protein N826_20235 [Skermanella aerolata KACC 11604]GEO35893.1 hypothetical protein SAE02_00410 [Skermanella aerolata]